ncbi:MULTISPECIES: hypothetical protein [Streptomyces]|nr:MULTISPECIES: hypothetical protein [Streptomyces]MYT07984.1 hypothetical protein [Streptomyces sp. SID5470]
MQESAQSAQNKESVSLAETAEVTQPEFIEIRLLDKIETIESKSIVR